ncbi:methylamine utilization protein [Halomonas urumqiensis]|uniref:Cupredoxin n=1 Tax=Halomonas urumqiensis TaxID=1684789 RepID=A0A2N7UKB1_9GAMM|nr:methylamine utilization protein [Halomonas urumqiensis]PMR80876.1 Cupredoxin [Halomonas urumqiensis]PTB02833.1 methylamine utilization protein [Halomonas urumqiensis]GHE21346.1 hypothetical protein GCM10017767_18670 [Halomonas urumqiensis]
MLTIKHGYHHMILLTVTLGFACPTLAARLAISDAATGQPLENAVVEIFHGDMPPANDANQVIQREATFTPHVTLIPTGSQVSFPNRDTTRHHVFSFSPAKVFELELYLQETPPPITFDRPGVVVLGCNIHDHMRAFIIVSDAANMVLTGSDGTARFDELPTGTHRMRVWHPRLEDTHQQWWEGEIAPGESREVMLELQASPPPTPEPSRLQQRFRQALEQQES